MKKKTVFSLVNILIKIEAQPAPPQPTLNPEPQPPPQPQPAEEDDGFTSDEEEAEEPPAQPVVEQNQTEEDEWVTSLSAAIYKIVFTFVHSLSTALFVLSQVKSMKAQCWQ
jgi:hypothetical protein